MTKKRQDSFKELGRYAFVGIVSNLVGYLVYFLVTYIGISPKIAMTILYVVGATSGYIGNRKFTFAYNGSFMGSGFRYLIAQFLGYLINLFILIVFVDCYTYPHQWVQAAAIFIVAGFLFIAFKFFVFPNVNLTTVSRK